MKGKKLTRKERREKIKQVQLGWELVRLIRHFFPDLIWQLKGVTDQRHQSYIRYENHVLLMTRILASIFYISSMRKASEELNKEEVIANMGYVCGQELEELPYWETINLYLEKVADQELQEMICKLVKRLLRSRAFESSRIRGRYWQVIVDGTQLASSRKELDGGCLYRVHQKGTREEYVEYYYYVLEAKLYLHENIYVSIMTEFVENKDSEAEKQDCERKAAKRLMKRLKEQFPMLPILSCADSLYACESMFELCRKYHWSFLIRYKKGSNSFCLSGVRKSAKTGKELPGISKQRQSLLVRSYQWDRLQWLSYQSAGVWRVRRKTLLLPDESAHYVEKQSPVTD